ncbi:hypothetical protein CP532_0382 [Ophiocordyceps camponoti-leonardi (nom. inval.)]|nr:hypothetical protein CP532_0382 [Ophiocordyceps camponoti-leonardi (nom. inval.)]
MCQSLFAKLPRNYLHRLRQGDRASCPPCRTIDSLEIGVWLSPEYSSGTWDTILAAVSGRQPHLFIAREPEAGFQDWKTFNLRQIFGSRRVPIRDVDRISLVDVALAEWYQRDDWLLQGVVLKARCVGSSRMIQVDRYRYINRPLHHDRSWGPQVVWSDAIELSDWRLVPHPPISHN